MQLLNKNPGKRLGCVEKGEPEIKSHSFFRRVDWNKIEAREVQPPFKPKIVSFPLNFYRVLKWVPIYEPSSLLGTFR